jgi:hypothetical protein
MQRRGGGGDYSRARAEAIEGSVGCSGRGSHFMVTGGGGQMGLGFVGSFIYFQFVDGPTRK